MKDIRLACALAAVVAAAGIVACGDSGEPQDTAETVGGQVAAATGAEPAPAAEPCDILDDELIRRHFAPGEAEITRKPSEHSPHPLCTASWPRPDAAEIEARRDAEMADYLRRKMQGEEVERPALRTADEVSLTLSKDRFEEPAQAMASFDSAMRILTEGMTVEAGGREVETPSYEIEPVEGVGRKAMWAPELHQLSVVTDHRIFHVGVRTDAEAELDQAVAVARDVAARL